MSADKISRRRYTQRQQLQLDRAISRCPSCGQWTIERRYARTRHDCERCPEWHPRAPFRCDQPRGHDGPHTLTPFGETASWTTS